MLAVLCTFQCTCCNQAAKLNDTRHPAWGRLKWTALITGIALVWPVAAQAWWVTKVVGFRGVWLTVVYSGTVIVFRLSIAIKLFQRPESAHTDAQPLVGGAIAGAPIAVLTTTHPDGRVIQQYVQQPAGAGAYYPPAAGTFAQVPVAGGGASYGAIAAAVPHAQPVQPVKTEAP